MEDNNNPKQYFKQITGFSKPSDEEVTVASEEVIYGIAVNIKCDTSELKDKWLTYFGSIYYVIGALEAFFEALDLIDENAVFNHILYELDDNLTPVKVICSVSFTTIQAAKIGKSRGFTLRDATHIYNTNDKPFGLEF